MKKSMIKSLIKSSNKVISVMYKKKNEELVKEVLNELNIQADLFENEKYDCFVSSQKYYNAYVTVEEYEDIMELEYAQMIEDTLQMLGEEKEEAPFGFSPIGYYEFEEEPSFA